MTSYWITFRIANRTVNGKTYDARYEALREAIRLRSSKWWLKPTSYIAFASQDEIDVLAKACKAAIAPEYDMFLMRKMDEKNAIICGANDDRDIYDLMPYLESI